jgi:molybdate/tungstate transport system substrate-binding protein
MIAEEQKSPDIVAVADPALFNGPLHPSWYGMFATNSLVLAYQTDTDGGQRIASAERDRWFELILNGTARLGRTDPDLDPLGYRTLFMLELANRYYETDLSLHEQLPEDARIFPETQLVSQFETGAIDVAVTYQSMAVERGYEYIELPPEINFGHREYTDNWYSTVSYSLPDGNSVEGALICYGAIIRNQQEKTVHTYEAMTDGSYLQEFGFGHPNAFPVYKGNVPAQLTN